MCRLASPGNLCMRQTRELEVTYGGAEANVAASICNFGGAARYVTALPKHALAEATIDTLRGVGIDTQFVLRTDAGRLGIYFLETGANQRPSRVIYDREGSAFSRTTPDQYDWEAALADADWLHVTGISPAVSGAAADATRQAVAEAKQRGIAVSCDLNFRQKLWRWDPQSSPRDLAESTMRELLPSIDLLIANEEDCAQVLGIRAGQTDVDAGNLEISRYPEVAKEVVKQFPNLTHVAITLRESISASHNNWGAMLWDSAEGQHHFAPTTGEAYAPYEIRNIVDRVGGGDSFAAGLIFALNTPELRSPATALRFAVAASCLAHSIVGDFNFSSREDVEKLMGGVGAGRVER